MAASREADPAIDPAIDGVRPAIVCRPGSAAEVGEALAIAQGHSAAVAPTGGATKLGLGNPPRRLDILLALDALIGIVDYSPADLTVTCRAGTVWRDLQAHLAAHGQFVPIDPPFADRATVGGVLATNSYGPSRIGYGTARDHLIGVAVANPDGAVTRAGGKVVKNVAGYDLNKLYIGSLGTVGVIVEATWKLLPVPVASATLLFSLDGPNAATDIATRV
ncbi:MAG TPA: FAD-binding oxidoreductase, partial [Dehalococcoidia bacterium]|nr:FAD-binding oxidoreductase [Dehalococcoidia bacterium]